MYAAWQTITHSTKKFKFATIAMAFIAAEFVPLFATPNVAHAVTDCSPNSIVSGGAASNWLSGSGVNVCTAGDDSNNYVNNSDGVSTLSGWKWECVELVNRLYLTKGWTTANWLGNGNTMVDHVPSNLDEEDNGHISYVNPGDVITLDNGGAGHAAIINTVSGNTVNIINQNATLNSSASINSGTLTGGNASYSMNNWYGYSVQAFVHQPDANTGGTGLTRVTGDWDGNGTTTVGFVRIHGSYLEWHLRNSNSAGSSDLVFDYGPSTATPIVGDWDGNGTDTVGFTTPSGSNLSWHLRNSNSAGSSDLAFDYGAATDNGYGITGDWDGNGTTTVGFTRASGSDLAWRMRNSNSAGSSDLIFNYGISTDNGNGITGDWDGNGTTTVGFTRISGSNLVWRLRNSNSAGSSDLIFNYGTSTGIPVVGDWDGNSTTTIGFTSTHGTYSSWHLRNSNDAGSSDLIFDYGPAN